jgi:hypothetical protein
MASIIGYSLFRAASSSIAKHVCRFTNIAPRYNTASRSKVENTHLRQWLIGDSAVVELAVGV